MVKLPSMVQLPKRTVGNAVKLPNLPSGYFTVFAYEEGQTTKGIVVFRYKNRARCSDLSTNTHKTLPVVPQPSDYPSLLYKNIGAGSAFLGEENDFFIENDEIVLKKSPVSEACAPSAITDDVLENKRRDDMVSAIRKYVTDTQKNCKISNCVETAGAEHCPFSGGGDWFIYEGDLGVMVVHNIKEDDEDEDEDEYAWIVATAVETKVQALAFEKIISQLKANMLVCTTTRFVQLCQNKPKKAQCITKLITFGLIVGLGKPIYLVSSEMDFKTRDTRYTLLMKNQWGSKAAIHIDRALHYCLTQMEKNERMEEN